MYGVCTLFHSVGGDRTSILSQLGRRISTEDVRVFLQVTSMFGTENHKEEGYGQKDLSWYFKF